MAHGTTGVRSRHRAGYAAQRGSHGGGFDPTESTLSLYGSEMDVEGIQIGGPETQGTLDGTTGITPGSLGLTPFASSIRPVAIVTGGSGATGGALLLENGSALLWETGDRAVSEDFSGGSATDLMPALPDAAYPEGCVVYNISDGKLYRNVAEVWTCAVDGEDLIAGSVIAGKIAAGAISATEIAVVNLSAIAADMGTLTAGVVRDASSKIVLDLSAQKITVSDGVVDRVVLGALGGGDYGLKVYGSDGTLIIDGNSNVFKILGTGTLSLTVARGDFDSQTVTLNALGTFAQFPAHHMLQGGVNGFQSVGALLLTDWNSGSGHPLNIEGFCLAYLGRAGNYVSITHRCDYSYVTGNGSLTMSARYYVFAEAGL